MFENGYLVIDAGRHLHIHNGLATSLYGETSMISGGSHNSSRFEVSGSQAELRSSSAKPGLQAECALPAFERNGQFLRGIALAAWRIATIMPYPDLHLRLPHEYAGIWSAMRFLSLSVSVMPSRADRVVFRLADPHVLAV